MPGSQRWLAAEQDEVVPGPGGLKISFEPMPHRRSSLNSSTSEVNTSQSSSEAGKREISCIPTSESCDQGLKSKMDEYLEWHDENVRPTVVGYIFKTYFEKAMTGVK